MKIVYVAVVEVALLNVEEASVVAAQPVVELNELVEQTNNLRESSPPRKSGSEVVA